MISRWKAFVLAGVWTGLISGSPATGLSAPESPIAPSAERGLAFGFAPEAGRLEIRFRGQPLLVYAFATNQFKSYVRELRTLSGENLLLDAPPDHLHHHGLMYAIRVNGVNFWEERDAPGYERSVRVDPPRVLVSPDGLPQASFSQILHWMPSPPAEAREANSSILLIEHRTLTLTVDEGRGEVALSWSGEFELGPGMPRVTLTGATYHGLGLRLPAEFNLVARHENSEGKAYPTEGKGDVTPARWSSVSGSLHGQGVTLALFGRPDVSRGLPRFFTMVQPFAYLSVTQGLNEAPLEYSKGSTFQISYLLLAYNQERPGSFVQERYRRWIASGH